MPYHRIRRKSSGGMEAYPSSAYRRISGQTSRPSFSFLIASTSAFAIALSFKTPDAAPLCALLTKLLRLVCYYTAFYVQVAAMIADRSEKKCKPGGNPSRESCFATLCRQINRASDVNQRRSYPREYGLATKQSICSIR